jgi:hypothetical protein
MELHSLRKDNTVKVLYSIQNGNDTIANISNDTALSQMSVSKIVKELIAKNILEITKPKRSISGRRTMKFSISNRFYVAYAEEHEGGFCVIMINAKEDAVDRFDIQHRIGEIGYIRTFTKFVLRKDYRDCVGVFMDFSNPNPPRIPTNFIKMSKTEIIINAFSDENKIIFFKTKDNLILSIYGKTIYSNCSVEDAKKVLPMDELYEIDENKYDLLFQAMAKLTVKRILSLID